MFPAKSLSVVVLCGALLATGAPPARADAPAPASTDRSPPQIRDVKFSRTSVAVRGRAVVPVRVSMRLTDPSGIVDNPHDMQPSPQLILGPVPGHQAKLRPVLTRTAGTATDGTWSATVNVPSTWNGTVRITSVSARDQAGNELSVTRAVALRVRGTHRPALTFHYSTLAGGGFRIHGRATYTDTGRPIRKLPLATAYDSNCDFDGGATNDIATDSRGYYEKRYRNGEEGAAGCVALIGPAARHQRPAVLAYRLASAPTHPVPPALAVPAAAMVQPEDLNGAETTTVTDDYWSALRPPQPCGPYGSAKVRHSERAVQAMIGFEDRPTVIVNHVATYPSGGADDYLQDLRKAVTVCASQWTMIGTGVAGDESVLLRRREYLDYAEQNKDTYVVVARTGRALVIVADTGWETGSGHESLARSLSVAAVRRAAVVRGG